MKIRPIKSEQDYEQALSHIEQLMDAKPGTKRGDELDILTTLVEAYEDVQQFVRNSRQMSPESKFILYAIPFPIDPKLGS